MKVLISGAGIAGPTLAYWLTHYGFETTLVERSPALRTGGYIIDFWGAGFEVAERMGVLPEVLRNGYQVEEVRIDNRDGSRAAGFPASAFKRATSGRFTSLSRADLAAILFRSVGEKIETIFDDSVAHIEQDEQRAHVRFESGMQRDFDVVIGADGQHSRVRELVFGAENQFEKYLGFKVAAFQAEGYRPRTELAYLMYTEIGQQVARFTMRDNRTMFLFTFADAAPELPNGIVAQKALLHHRFGQSGWECPTILEALDAAPELYFDRVSQIRMDPSTGLWTRGRVSLVGDAASCVSFLAGQGSALAMVGAYVLAGELHRAGDDYARGLARYQQLFGPFVAKKQQAALRFGSAFAPGSKVSLWLRNQVMNLMNIQWVANRIVGAGFSDKLTLPNY
jgi:2-polyprenyl-6-methoxyphenol hydroxylase-like FAD-dependent oxidoreductase